MEWEDVEDRVSKHYGKFPGPDKRCFDAAVSISKELIKKGIYKAGVIGVAFSDKKELYFAFSARLNKKVCDNVKSQSVAAVVEGIISGSEADPEVKAMNCIFCGIIDEVMELFQNSSCAEKKIITKMNRRKQKMQGIAVIAHPCDRFVPKSLATHVAVGDKNEEFIAPCESCKAFANAYLALAPSSRSGWTRNGLRNSTSSAWTR